MKQVVRVLAVDQGLAAVGGLAGLQQQRIAVLAHQRIGRDHGAQAERAVARARAAP